MADRTVTVSIDAEIARFLAKMRVMQQATGELNKKFLELDGKGKTRELESAVTGTAAALGLLMGAAVVTAARYEQAMSRVQAATKASSAEMAQLRAATMQAGQQGTFTAIEAADAVTELGKAGLTTAQILAGGLTGALNLAAAGELAVGKAAELAASALTQFKLSGDQVPHVADLLAAGAGKAQGSVEDMGMALNQTGLVASQAGLSIEETTGALGAFASAGLIGSDSGTSFKTMLQRLTAPTQESAQLMRDLGISAFDSQGKFVGLAKFAGNLRGALIGMTDEQRNATLATLFGSDAIRAAAVIYEQGENGIKGWIGKVNDSGYAAEQARIKTDNLIGDLNRLKGAFTNVLIDTGGGANGVLRWLTKTIGGLVQAFGSLHPAVSGTVTALVLLGTVVVGGVMAWMKILPALTVIKTTMGTMFDPVIAKSNLATVAVTRFGAAMRVVGAAAGILGAVMIAASIFMAIKQSAEEAEAPVEGLADSLAYFARTGNLSGEAAKKYGKNLEVLSGDVEKHMSAIKKGVSEGTLDINWDHVLGGGPSSGSTGKAVGAVNALKEATAGLDKELSGMVRGGSMAEAQAAFQKLKAEMAASGVPLSHLNVLFPEYNQAVLDATNSVPELADGLGQYKTELDLAVVSMTEALATGMSLIDMFNALNGEAISLARAQIKASDAWGALKKALDENGAAFDTNSEKGKENLGLLLNLAEAWAAESQAMLDNGASSEELAKHWSKKRGEVEKLLRALGMEEAQIKALMDLYFKMPTTIATTYKSNIASHQKKIKDLIAEIDNVPHTVYTDFIMRKIYQESKALQYDSRKGYADGGFHFESYASGGLKEDHRAQIAPAGTMRMWAEPETGGEGYIPLGMSKRPGAEAVWTRIGKHFGLLSTASMGATRSSGVQIGEVTIRAFSNDFDYGQVRQQFANWGVV